MVVTASVVSSVLGKPCLARRTSSTARPASGTRILRPAASLSYRGVNRASRPQQPAFLDGCKQYTSLQVPNPPSQPAATADASGAYDSSPSSGGMGTVLLSVLAASMAAFSFGWALSVVNGPLEQISIDLGFGGNAALQGLVVSTVLIGASLGSLSGSSVADNMGRKGGLIACSVPLLAGALLCANATAFNMLAAGRFLTGIGIGLASALVPVYISEIAPTALRGAFGTINQLAICFGILGGLVANVVLPATAWKSMFMIGALPAVLLGLGMLLSPESPRFLAGKGDSKGATAEALRLWGSTAELDEDAGAAAEAGQAAPGLGELLANRGVRIGMMMFVLQQFSGINAIIYFSTSVFQQAGVASTAIASAAVGACNVLGTVIAGSVIEKAGRKQLLMLSYFGMGMNMFAMAAGLGLPQLKEVSGIVALLGTLTYILSFALGAGPVAGLLVPEITTARIRGSAMSMAMVTHWVCNVIVGQFFLAAVAKFGVSGVYCGFGAVCVLALVYIQAAVVETKGKSTEEIIKLMA